MGESRIHSLDDLVIQVYCRDTRVNCVVFVCKLALLPSLVVPLPANCAKIDVSAIKACGVDSISVIFVCGCGDGG